FEVREMPNWFNRYNGRRCGHKQRHAVQPFVSTKAEHQLLDRRISCNALPIWQGGDDTGGRRKSETFIDSSQKFWRNNQTLDRAELHALRLPLRRTQSTLGINLGFDAPPRIPLNDGGIPFRELMQRIVNGS